MQDYWKKIPKKDWEIAEIIGFKYPPVVHTSGSSSARCPTPEICGRYIWSRPWSRQVQEKIEEIKKL